MGAIQGQISVLSKEKMTMKALSPGGENPPGDGSRFEPLNRGVAASRESAAIVETQSAALSRDAATGGGFMGREDLKFLTRVVTMNRSRRRQSALISFAGRWRGLTSAATRFMGMAGVDYGKKP